MILKWFCSYIFIWIDALTMASTIVLNGVDELLIKIHKNFIILG